MLQCALSRFGGQLFFMKKPQHRFIVVEALACSTALSGGSVQRSPCQIMARKHDVKSQLAKPVQRLKLNDIYKKLRRHQQQSSFCNASRQHTVANIAIGREPRSNCGAPSSPRGRELFQG